MKIWTHILNPLITNLNTKKKKKKVKYYFSIPRRLNFSVFVFLDINAMNSSFILLQ